MAEEMTNQEQETSVEQDYIAAINNLKNTTVSRDEYDKLRGENKRLLDAMVNGKEEAAKEEAKANRPNKDELRKELYGGSCNLSNLDYWKKTLELRDIIIDEGGKDPFLPIGTKIAATAEDVEKAQNVADGIKEIIEYADGDSGIFTNELQRRTVDTVGAPRGNRRR